MKDIHAGNENVFLQQFSEALSEIPFNKMVGIKIDRISREQILLSFEMKPELIGNFYKGILHGGVISSVLDMAGGICSMASVIFKHPEYTHEQILKIITQCSTIDLQINFLRQGKGEHFIAEAKLDKHGKQITFVRMELRNQYQDIIATASGNYLLNNIL